MAVAAPVLFDLLTQVEAFLQEETPVMNGVFRRNCQCFDVDSIVSDTRRSDTASIVATRISTDNTNGMVIHSTDLVTWLGLVQNRSPRNHLLNGAANPTGTTQIKPMLPILSTSDTQFELEDDSWRTMWHKLLRNLSSASTSELTGGLAYDVL